MALRPYAARIQFQSRVAMGGSSTTSTQFTATAPYWVKLVRSGNTFTGYKSPDGITWTLAGSATISMSATASIGLAVSAYDNTKLCTATFDNVTVTLNE